MEYIFKYSSTNELNVKVYDFKFFNFVRIGCMLNKNHGQSISIYLGVGIKYQLILGAHKWNTKVNFGEMYDA